MIEPRFNKHTIDKITNTLKSGEYDIISVENEFSPIPCREQTVTAIARVDGLKIEIKITECKVIK